MSDVVLRVLKPSALLHEHKAAGRIAACHQDAWNRKISQKGIGFQHPLGPYEHWHVDLSYLNIARRFNYLCSLLDALSQGECQSWLSGGLPSCPRVS
jgi:putative transposase